MQNQIRNGLVASLLTLALTACGSGGGGTDTANANFNESVFNEGITPCTNAPDSALCREYTEQAFCSVRGNANSPRCATILNQPNTATWLQSFASPLPATTREASHRTAFLQVSADGTVDTTGLTINSDSVNRRIRTLNREGDSNDGVVFFKGAPSGGGAEQFFAGILATTNLGAPVLSTTPDATWTGSYRRAGNARVNNVSFDIDFLNREIDATAPIPESNDIDNLSSLRAEARRREILASIGGSNPTFLGRRLVFDLEFTPNGVIEGTVVFDYTRVIDSADVTGLIGQEGLVGAFVDSTAGQRGLQNFYGGFWAEPTSQ